MIKDELELEEAKNAIFVLADASEGSAGAKERDMMIQQVDEYEDEYYQEAEMFV